MLRIKTTFELCTSIKKGLSPPGLYLCSSVVDPRPIKLLVTCFIVFNCTISNTGLQHAETTSPNSRLQRAKATLNCDIGSQQHRLTWMANSIHHAMLGGAGHIAPKITTYTDNLWPVNPILNYTLLFLLTVTISLEIPVSLFASPILSLLYARAKHSYIPEK